MKTIEFNDAWRFRHLNEEEGAEQEEWKEVSIPHDAMIFEERSIENDAGTNACWFKGRDYEYEKEFDVPADFGDKTVVFEFEGVYHNAEVYINGEKACYRPYGYTNFYVEADSYLKYGERNTIRVIARNSDQPNSRWYSGAGIYRPVHIHVLERDHILINGVKIKTLQVNPAIVEVRVNTNVPGDVSIELQRNGETIASQSQSTDGDVTFAFVFELEHADLWTPEHPNLYNCHVKFGNDERDEVFGIRTIKCNTYDGFCINDERVIIKGCCIHHDNGILGARCYEEAEYRKIKILKDAGYNAIRSAHNPCSKAMVRACDEMGMMILDEYCDMWYIHKTRYDYATYVKDWYQQDLKDLVDKDYNHPSVIMYSFGNEVAETGQPQGIEFFKEMRDYVKKLDDRPITTGVNIFFNFLYSMGFGVYSDKKAEENPQKKVGSEFFNNLAGIFGDGFMKTMAKLHGCDVKTRGCFAEMDAAGYNYGILRYKKDVKKYPERVILGSETFCSDAYMFYEYAKNHNNVIGDFVWAGMDYLGELGVGSWEYKEYAPEFTHGPGWMTAGSGRVDLIGTELGEALYTKVAFELEDKPQIAVVPVNHTGEKHSPSAWKFSNAIPSWSWNGLDGKKADVEVYSRAPVIELYVNGKRVARKKFKKNCRFDFRIKYHGGEITAVALDEEGNELSRNSLHTAGDETILSVLPEKEHVSEGEVCFVRLRFTDNNGTVKPLVHQDITVNVEGAELLAVGSASPFSEKGYTGDTTNSYYGEAMAVIRMTSPSATVNAVSGDYHGSATISVA